MGVFAFKAIGLFVVILVIFILGFVAGGAFASGMAVEQFQSCLPAVDIAALEPCMDGAAS
ncbi:hypothetical protein [Microbacterium sp.]|uniref:hypothetical protein n=1 Tax=Microbacterium sp. TaxID=51671 RepID=UPI00333F46B3